MNFEDLPNELILDLFDYFDLLNLLLTFYNLNNRLNTLLGQSRKNFHRDFRNLSKSTYEGIYQEYHPSIDDQVISIHLADDDATPNLPEIFFSNHFLPAYFPHLQSLCLSSTVSSKILHQIVIQCRELPCLAELNLIQCRVNDSSFDIINPIWELPNLITCTIDEDMVEGGCFTRLCQTSSSMKSLSIDNVNCDFSCLSEILQRTPSLEHLSIKIVTTDPREVFPLSLPLLTQLTLCFRGSLGSLKTLFAQMPNLHSLTYSRSTLALRGNEWEEIFTRYLPNIRQFRLRINCTFVPSDDPEEKIDQLLQTFQTDFWLKKHQWFVQCDWNQLNPLSAVKLYTLPYTFPHFHLTNGLCSKSTCPNSSDFSSYKTVRNLLCHKTITYPSSIQFPSLTHLEVILPFNENLFANIPSWTHLTTLDVTLLPVPIVYEQLQALLDRTTNLYLLRFSQLSELEKPLFDLRNPSIRRLDFFTKESMIYSTYFTREQCIALADSSLGQQCEILVIDIEHRTHILELINRMNKLRSLTFQCKDDKWKYKSSTTATTTDELLQWFHEHLPRTYSISRHVERTSIFQLWIR